MKKLLAFLLILTVSISGFLYTGCNQPDGTPDTVKFYVPDGAPALAVAQLVDKTIGGKKIDVHVVSGDQIAGKVASGEADLAIMPTNAAANLFNKNKDIRLVSANVHGLLYMVGKENLTSLEQLKGKVVYNIGQGQTPDATFQYILQQNEIEYVVSETPVAGKVALQYVSDGASLIGFLKSGKASFGILGEPAATQAVSKAGVSVLFDIQAEWRAVTNLGNFPQASMIMKTSLTENVAFVDAILAALSDNDEWIKTNATAARQALVGVGSSLPETLTNEIVVRCNIDTVVAQDAKAEIIAYLNVLYNFNPNFVGGSLPADSFFYGQN